MTFLNAGRAGFAAQSLGLAEFCLDQAVAHAKTRTAFGKPLGGEPGRVVPARRVQGRDRGDALDDLPPRLGGRPGRGRPLLDSSIAKFYATERAYAVADRCLQVFGGMGLLREGPVERVLRHLRVLRVVEGASEVQKLVIARSLGLG